MDVAVVEETAIAGLGSGIDLSGFDTSVRPQDDLFGYVNGKWIAETNQERRRLETLLVLGLAGQNANRLPDLD